MKICPTCKIALAPFFEMPENTFLQRFICLQCRYILPLDWKQHALQVKITNPKNPEEFITVTESTDHNGESAFWVNTETGEGFEIGYDQFKKWYMETM